jgi:hypothetical protein
MIKEKKGEPLDPGEKKSFPAGKRGIVTGSVWRRNLTMKWADNPRHRTKGIK